MASITSNGTGGGNWSDGSTWVGGVAPGANDQATIVAADDVFLDGDISIGDGTDATTTFQLMIYGNLVVRNRTTDSASDWTFTINGHARIYNGGKWFIGTQDSSLFGAESIGPIPASRKITVNFSNNYYHYVSVYAWTDSYNEYVQEFWGAENYHQAVPDSISDYTVDSAADRNSFVDSALLVAGPVGSSWDFDGSSDSLRLEGTDSKAAIFDPSSQNDDFTVCAVIAPDLAVLTHAGVIMSKLTVTAGNHRCWYMHQSDDAMTMAISQNGDNGTTTNLLSPPCLQVGKKSFVSLRYEYSGTPGASSWLEAGCDGFVTTDAFAYGPIHSSTNADVQIGDYDASGSRHFDGKIYWIAYWNRKLSDSEMESLRNGLYPGNLTPDAYIDFSKAVGATYDMELPVVDPIQFAVEGTPIQLGSSDPVAWRGAWLEVTAGTNLGEKREVTAFNGSTGKIDWSADQPMPDPCDATTVYSLQHNYSRAMLAADANAGTNVIMLDRAVDWEVDDEIAIAVGADFEQNDSRPERATIQTKNSSTEYVLSSNLTYNKKAGDFVIHFTKNIKFNATNIVSSNTGYVMYYNQSSSRPGVKWNWVFFDNCCQGGSGALLWRNSESGFPVIRHCTMAGYLYSTSTVPQASLIEISGGDPRNIAEEFQIEDVHVYNVGTFIEYSSQMHDAITVEELERLKFRDCSFIGCNNSFGYMFQTPSDEGGVLPHLYNMWMTGRPIISNNARNGQFSTGVGFTLDGFRIRQTANGAWFSNYDQAKAMFSEDFQIRNGYFDGLESSPLSLYLFPYPICLVENVCIDGRGGGAGAGSYRGLYLQDPIPGTIIMMNNKIDGCTEGIHFRPYPKRIFEFDSEYGVRAPNINQNVLVYTANARFGVYQHIAQNCKYISPTSLAWNELAINKIVSNEGNPPTYLTKVGWQSAPSAFEFHNPDIDGVVEHSMGLVQFSVFLEILDHPTEPRDTSNIKMKITPYSYLAPAKVNFRLPFTFYAATGKEVSVSVYVRKNVTLEAGKRPQLVVYGNGVFKTVEMTDAIDTWEQLTVEYTALFDGGARAWLNCYSSLRHDLNSTDDQAEWAEAAPYGTVVVYADELEITVSE